MDLPSWAVVFGWKLTATTLSLRYGRVAFVACSVCRAFVRLLHLMQLYTKSYLSRFYRVLQYSLSLASPARADMGHVHMLRWITNCDAENVTPNASRENKLTLGMAALSFLPAY